MDEENKEQMQNVVVAKVLGFVIGMIILFLFSSSMIYLIWNNVLIDLFTSLPKITFIQINRYSYNN